MQRVIILVVLTLVSIVAAMPWEFDNQMGEWNGNYDQSVFSYSEYSSGCGGREAGFGRDTWNFLHTLAANYPEDPSPEQQEKMMDMMRIFVYFYPRPNYYFRRSAMQEEPDTANRESFSQWMCRLHNRVNIQKGKPMFDCASVNEYWMNDCFQSLGEGCDPDRSETGRATWNFMHTFAYTYPENPTPEEQEDMRRLMYYIAEFYPSPNYYYITSMFYDEPDTMSRESFMDWMCRTHNYVNARKGRPEFDCSQTWQQWQYSGC